ncbi:MAG: ferritin [Pseudomonadota bacterium]
MQLNERVADALNRQINSELSAAYTYMAMAAWFDAQDLAGFALWFRTHAAEEQTHAQKIYDFVVARDAPVELIGMEKPKSDYKTPSEVLEAALSHERVVTEQIHRLFQLAKEENEFSTQSMLNWFLDEQVQEEDLFREVLKQVNAASGDNWNMLLLDKELKARAAVATTQAVSAPVA